MFANVSGHTKLNVAVTRLAAFVADLPLAPDERDILEYHDIIRLFEEACSQDLSPYKIASQQVRAAAARTAVSFGEPLRTRHPAKRCVEFVYFRRQLRGLIASLMTVLSSRPN